MIRSMLVKIGLAIAFQMPLAVLTAQDAPLTSQVLLEKIEVLRKDVKLVGLGATVMVDGNIVATAACGKRHQNEDALVTIDDKWHLGSITKSMTATVIGRLVERGQLSWDSRLPELLPAKFSAIDEGWNAVTLHQLLTHTAGLPANFPLAVQFENPNDRDTLHIKREETLAGILAIPPDSVPGEQFVYSNVGYTLAGYIAAEKANSTWEALIEAELFVPLTLQSAGFGAPLGTQPFDQPWGHRRMLFLRTPMDPQQRADNTPVMGPAGIVHMAMADLAAFGLEHLHGETRDTGLLTQKTFQKLHEPVMNDYACGWVSWQRDWAGGRVLWHNGTNTMWYSLLMLIPSKNAVVVIVTNDGNINKAESAFFELAKTIVKALPVRK